MLLHDLLENKSRSVSCIAVEFENGVLTAGYLFVNNVKEREHIVTSITGHSYQVTVPEEYLNIRYGSQFNVSIQAKSLGVH